MSPGTYLGMVPDLLTLVANSSLSPGWGIGLLLYFRSKILRKTCGIRFAAAILDIELETLLMGVSVTVS